MTFPHDDPDMSTGHDLDDRLVEDLLHGRSTSRSLEQHRLRAAIAALRETSAVHPRPNPELQQLFTEGLGPAPAPVAPEASRRIAAWHPLRLRPVAARIAGLGLAAKLLLGGTAVAATAVGGAGLAGVLPGQVDHDQGMVPPELEHEAPTPEAPDAPGPVDTGVEDVPAGGIAPEPAPRDTPAPPGDTGDGRRTDRSIAEPDEPVDAPPTPPPGPGHTAPPRSDPTDPPAADTAPLPAPVPETADPPDRPTAEPAARPEPSDAAGSTSPGSEDADAADPPEPDGTESAADGAPTRVVGDAP